MRIHSPVIVAATDNDVEQTDATYERFVYFDPERNDTFVLTGIPYRSIKLRWGKLTPTAEETQRLAKKAGWFIFGQKTPTEIVIENYKYVEFVVVADIKGLFPKLANITPVLKLGNKINEDYIIQNLATMLRTPYGKSTTVHFYQGRWQKK